MIACGHYPAFFRAQGVDNIHPGDGPGTGSAAQKSPALSPRCTQIPGTFAQVIHKFAHREARLAADRGSLASQHDAANKGPGTGRDGAWRPGPGPSGSSIRALGRACRPEATGGLPPAGDLGSEHGRSPQRAPSATTTPVSEGIRHAASRTGMSEPVPRACPSQFQVPAQRGHCRHPG